MVVVANVLAEMVSAFEPIFAAISETSQGNSCITNGMCFSYDM